MPREQWRPLLILRPVMEHRDPDALAAILLDEVKDDPAVVYGPPVDQWDRFGRRVVKRVWQLAAAVNDGTVTS